MKKSLKNVCKIFHFGEERDVCFGWDGLVGVKKSRFLANTYTHVFV